MVAAVTLFQRAMMMDVGQAAKAMRDVEMEAEIEDFLEGFEQPAYRGRRINGVRVPVWSSRSRWSGMQLNWLILRFFKKAKFGQHSPSGADRSDNALF